MEASSRNQASAVLPCHDGYTGHGVEGTVQGEVGVMVRLASSEAPGFFSGAWRLLDCGVMSLFCMGFNRYRGRIKLFGGKVRRYGSSSQSANRLALLPQSVLINLLSGASSERRQTFSEPRSLSMPNNTETAPVSYTHLTLPTKRIV